MTAVLFVRLSAMGDLMHGVGAIQALHRVRPDWRLTVATQTENAPLLAGVAGIAEVVEFDRRGGLGALWRLGARLRRARFDVAVDLQGNWKSALVARLSGALDRLGAGRQWRQEPASRVLLRRTVDVPGPDHPALVATTLVRALAPDAAFQAAVLRARPGEIAAERAALAAIGVDPGAPFRVLVISDAGDPRALRPTQIAAETIASGQAVVHLFGPAEAGLASAHPHALRHAPGEVRRLLALGAIVAQNGGEVIGPDQGAAHVLAATGARCRILFGSQDPTRTAPPAAIALVHPEPPNCSPCRRRDCRHERGPVCMEFAAAAGREIPFVLPSTLRGS